MKRTLLTVCVILMLFLNVRGQTDIRKEVTLNAKGFNNYGLMYRTGNDNALWRFGGIALTASKNKDYAFFESTDQRSSEKGAQFSIGREFRKRLSQDFVFCYGADISLAYTKRVESYFSSSTNYKVSIKEIRPGINGVIGVMYNVTDHFLIGAAMHPLAYYRIEKRDVHQYNNNTVDFSSRNSALVFSFYQNAVVSFTYKFYKSEVQ
jgi:hypothetical protein